MAPDAQSQSPGPRRSAPPRKRRRTTIVLWSFATVVIVFLLLTHSPLTARFVLPRLSALVGARVSAESVRIRPNGVVVLNRPKFTLEAPELSGPAATLAEATSAEGRLAIWSLVRGKVVLDKLVLEEPVVRVSQNLDNGTLNLGALRFDRGQTTSPDGTPRANPIGEVPLIVVDRGAIELGEHTKDGYTLLKRLSLNGTIEPALGPEGGFRIKLMQSKDGTIDVGSNLAVQGRVSSTGLTVSLQGFDLSDWPSTVMPTDLRGQFQSLELEGQISQAELNYDFVGIPTASLELAGVAMSLPVAADAAKAGVPPRRLRMTQTNGRLELDRAGLRANIRGMLEDLPYQADLKFDGTDPQGPFELELKSEGYTVGKSPAFKQFVNDTVKERLRDFGDPTGHVVTVAHIRRGPKVNGAGGPVLTTGLVRLTKGTAAFHKFPYPWSNIDAEIEFSDAEIRIKRLTGTNPQTGATISAQGTIGPLNDEAGVTLDIVGEHMPMDDVLYAAMKPGEREGLKAIFSQDEISRLEDADMIATPANRARLQALLAVADRAGNTAESKRLTDVLEHRAFSPRGTCSISVTLRRPIGLDKDWDQDIRVKAPGAGIVSQAFPLPMRAGAFELRIGNDDVEITGKDLQALSGGAADLSVRMTLEELRNGTDIVPHVDVVAKELKIDDLVRQAIAHSVTKYAGSSRARIVQMVHDMHIDGAVSGRVGVTPDPARPGGASVNLAVTGIDGLPQAEGTTPVFAMKNVGFALQTKADLFQINAAGSLLPPAGGPTMPFAVRAASAAWKEPQFQDRGAIDIQANIAALPLDADAGPVLSIFSVPAAGRVSSAQKSLACSGTGDVLTTVRLTGSGDLAHAAIDFSRLQHTTLTLMGTRLTLRDPVGALRVQAGQAIQGAEVSLKDFSALLLDNDDTAAKVLCSGSLIVGEGQGGQVDVQSGTMKIALTEGKYESPTLRAMAIASAPSISGLLKDWDPRGTFDMLLTWSPRQNTSVDALMSPKILDVQRGSQRVRFDSMGGEFAFTNTGGTFHDLSGNGSSWTAAVNGTVRFPDEHAAEPAQNASIFDTIVTLTSRGLPADLSAAMPEAVKKILAQLTVEIPADGTLELRDTHVNYTIGPSYEAVDARGQVLFTGAMLKAGVDISDAYGNLVFKTSTSGASVPVFEIDAAIERARVADLILTAGKVRAVSGVNNGDVHIPLITARCHGGLLSASGDLLLKSPGSSEKAYSLQVRLSGSNFAPVVDDFRKGSEHAASDDASRGVLDASLSLAGTVDEPKTRRGRLFATVGGGEIAKFPTLVAMMRLSNLQLPLSEPLDLARASANIDGERLNFEELVASSESIAMVGYGTMEWPSTELDLRFNSRSNWRMPLVSWALEKLRDELITTRVSGTVREPKIDTMSLPGAGSVLKDLSGRTTEQDRRLKEMKRESERGVK